MGETGAYRSSRAAALSGVPERTVHHWARQGLVVPAVSAQRIKLWSYEDLMALRIVSWLRKPKVVLSGSEIPPCPMPRVREALAQLRDLGLGVWEEGDGSRVLVDPSGDIFIRSDDSVLQGDQAVHAEVLDLLGPFEHFDLVGPDLRRPRPHLRIVPSKLSGEPHVEGTRLESRAVAALARRGFTSERLHEFYPFASAISLAECVDLEDQLTANLTRAAA